MYVYLYFNYLTSLGRRVCSSHKPSPYPTKKINHIVVAMNPQPGCKDEGETKNGLWCAHGLRMDIDFVKKSHVCIFYLIKNTLYLYNITLLDVTPSLIS